jgi:hypothetical protein
VLHGASSGEVIGEVDVRTGTLTVIAGAQDVGALLTSHPRLRVTDGGVRLDVTDAGSFLAAKALVRWRLGLERFAPQVRDASP